MSERSPAPSSPRPRPGPRSPNGRAALALGFAAALPLLLALDAGFARAQGWTPREIGLAILPTTVGLLALAAFLWVLPRTRRAVARRAGAWGVISVAVWVGLVLANLAVGQVRVVPLGELTHLRQPGTTVVFHPAPGVMPGIEGESRFRINSHGIRGDEIPRDPDTPLVLCIGGSTTECLYLDQEEAWPQLVQENLRRLGNDVWVGNAGISGYATPYHIRFVRASSLFDEIDSAVFLVGINDVVWELAGRDFSRIPLHPQEVIEPRALSTRLGRLATATWQRAAYRTGSLEVEDETGMVYAERRRLRAGSGSIADIELPLEAYVEFGRRIDELITACEERGIRPVLVTQPALWREDAPPAEEALYWMGDRADGTYGSSGSLRRILDRYGELVVKICEKRHVDCIDLRHLSGDPRLFYDDCHFNELGAAEVAAWVSRHLLVEGIIGS